MNSYYLRFGDIKGEVTEPAYRSWIKLKSWNFRQVLVGQAIDVTKEQDSTSAALYQYCISGKPGDAVIDMVKEDGTVLVRFEIPKAFIDSIRLDGSDPPVESAGLNGKIKATQLPGTPPP